MCERCTVINYISFGYPFWRTITSTITNKELRSFIVVKIIVFRNVVSVFTQIEIHEVTKNFIALHIWKDFVDKSNEMKKIDTIKKSSDWQSDWLEILILHDLNFGAEENRKKFSEANMHRTQKIEFWQTIFAKTFW